MRKLLAPIILAIPLTLTACGQTEFKDETEKEAAFAAKECKFAIENELSIGPFVSSQIIGDHDNYSSADTSKAFSLISVDQKYVDSEWDYYLNDPDVDPDFEPVPYPYANPAGDEACFGWTWEKYLEIQMAGSSYENFTFEEAQEAGVLEN